MMLQLLMKVIFYVWVLCLLYMWDCFVDGTWIDRGVAVISAPTLVTDRMMCSIDCHDK